MLSGGRSAALTCACWAFALLPGLAFACLALLISVVTQSSAAGMLGPLVVALVMQLLSLVGSGSILRAVLLSDALDAWHGLFVEPAFFGPLAWAALASIVYILACLSIAWVFLRRRDFAGPAPAPAGRGRPARRLALVVAVFAVLAAASSLGSTGVTAGRLEGSIGATFSNLTVLQQEYLGHHIPAGAMLPVLPTCRRQGVVEQNRGPGRRLALHPRRRHPDRRPGRGQLRRGRRGRRLLLRRRASRLHRPADDPRLARPAPDQPAVPIRRLLRGRAMTTHGESAGPLLVGASGCVQVAPVVGRGGRQNGSARVEDARSSLFAGEKSSEAPAPWIDGRKPTPLQPRL